MKILLYILFAPGKSFFLDNRIWGNIQNILIHTYVLVTTILNLKA